MIVSEQPAKVKKFSYEVISKMSDGSTAHVLTDGVDTREAVSRAKGGLISAHREAEAPEAQKVKHPLPVRTKSVVRLGS